MPQGTDWPAWVQAIGSIIGLLLAIYVPVRMRCLDALERRNEVLATISQLRRIGSDYIHTLRGVQVAAHAGVPPAGYAALELALRTALTGGIPADMIPSAIAAADAAEVVRRQWEAVGSSQNSANPRLIEAAASRQARVDRAHAAAVVAVNRWRRKHRLALAFA